MRPWEPMTTMPASCSPADSTIARQTGLPVDATAFARTPAERAIRAPLRATLRASRSALVAISGEA